MSDKISIKQYFDKGTFVIPDFQRGYKWSVKDKGEASSTEYFVESLLNAYNNNLAEYFIEAVTVVENDDKIILVDGQQRTTTLFLMFSVMNDFNITNIKIQYDIRKDSHQWLMNLPNSNKNEAEVDDTQDIFYFRQAIAQIKDKTQKVNRDNFLKYLQENIYLLYNIIPEDKAVNTFISLNGLKAQMKEEELIKSDLLIKSSRLPIPEVIANEDKMAIDWKINEDRGRLARNWDRWLYWWNQPAIRNFFDISPAQHPMYYLLVTCWNINRPDDKKSFSFENFKNVFCDSVRNSKNTFEKLRKLQKTFEDLYNDTESHNFLGLILRTSSSKESALQFFLSHDHRDKSLLQDYAKWALVYGTHLEIINNTIERKKDNDDSFEEIIVKERKANEAISLVASKYVYCDEKDGEFTDSRKELCFRFLLLLNLLQDNSLNRKFDFSIWENRSLEHIYPKSKKVQLDFEADQYISGSIHCLGNLVLLYGRDNASFGAKDFEDKKLAYFNTSSDFKIKSRNLLHTISVFAKSEWREKEIISNQKSTIQQLKNYYGI